MRKSLLFKVIAFMFVTFFFTIILAMVQELMKVDYRFITLPQWGPGLAALILSSLVLFRNSIDRSLRLSALTPARLLLCLLLPFGIIGSGYLLGKALGLTPGNILKLETQFFYITIPSSLFGAFGEVLGWRSFLQSSLDRKLNLVKAAVLTGVLWGLWHVGHYSNGAVYMGLFLIFTISSSIVIAYLIREFEFNLILAALFHLSINLGFFMFFRESTADVNMMLVNASLWLIVAIAILTPAFNGLINVRK